MTRAIPELPPGLWPALLRLAQSPADVVATARRHRLLPIAANDPSLDVCLRPAVQKAWEIDRPMQDAQAREVRAHVARMQAFLPPDDVIYIKGMVFGGRLYPDSSLRPMNDLDVLVRADRFATIAAQLRDLGYQEGEPRYFHATGWALPIELIPRFAHPSRHAIDHDAIFRERLVDAAGVPRLAVHHELLTYGLLCGTRLQVHLRKILDLWLLSRSRDVLAEATECARRWNLRRAFHASMCLVSQAFRDSGGEWRTQISGSVLAPSERRLVERTTATMSFDRNAHFLRLKWRRLGLLDSYARQLRFLGTRLIFGP